MIKSMTGYGRAVETVNGREFTVELRSVNNRYLDCTVKLPRSLSFAEEAVKQAVKASVSRGKVDVYITVKSENADDTKISLNTAVVEGYLAAMRQMVESYGVKDDISVSTLSRMNDVFTVEKPEVDEEQLKADMMGVLDKALAGYDAMRCTEGAALDKDLRSRGETILELVSQVEAGNGQTVIDYRTRLENKLREVLANTAIDESRILTEAAIFADKVAVDEETVRLRSHLSQMEELLANDKYDYTHPQSMPDGSLYYIRRPYRTGQKRSSPFGCLLDILLLPFRLLGALFGFLNVFSAKYSGKTLSGGRDVKNRDEQQMFIDGNLIQAEKELQANRKRGEANPGIIPHTWELRRRDANGNDTLIRAGVAAFRADRTSGELLFSNGSAILRRTPDGKESKVLDAQGVSFIC